MIMLTAQALALFSEKKARASDATQNTRLAILCSFYDYAIVRYLLLPMDNAGYVMNPIKIVDRAKVEAYHNIAWLEAGEVIQRMQKIDRSTRTGKRDYILLHILFSTGRRLEEVASLKFQHAHQCGVTITLTFEHCKEDKTMRDELPARYSAALLD